METTQTIESGFMDRKNKNGVQQARKVYPLHQKDVTSFLAAFKNGISQKPIALLQNLDNISKGFAKWLRAACFKGRSPTNSQVEIPAVKISGGQIPDIVWTNLVNETKDIKTNRIGVAQRSKQANLSCLRTYEVFQCSIWRFFDFSDKTQRLTVKYFQTQAVRRFLDALH